MFLSRVLLLKPFSKRLFPNPSTLCKAFNNPKLSSPLSRFQFSSSSEKSPSENPNVGAPFPEEEPRKPMGDNFVEFMQTPTVPYSYLYSSKTIYSIHECYRNFQTSLALRDFLPFPGWILATIITIKYAGVWFSFVPFLYSISSILKLYGTHLYTKMSKEFMKKTVYKMELLDPEHVRICVIDSSDHHIISRIEDIEISEIQTCMYETDDMKAAFFLIMAKFKDRMSERTHDLQLLINKSKTFVENVDLLKVVLQADLEEIRKFSYVPELSDRDINSLKSQLSKGLYYFDFKEEEKPKTPPPTPF